MAEWHFKAFASGDTYRNPIADEFFAAERNAAENLVRESIQNTLDARQTPGSTARVRIFFSGADGSLPPERAQHWFGGLESHVRAPGSGLRNAPSPNEACPFIAVEDFGTMGLTGDPTAPVPSPGAKNNFFDFFRGEGHSGKGGDSIGRWGIGKIVFPRCSRLKTFFGLSVPLGAGAVLMGRCILQTHAIGRTTYLPDGYFGERAGDFVSPSTASRFLDRFRRDFNLSRGMEEGLSVVVPWYETGADDAVSFDDILGAVLHGFYYPILIGRLEVTVERPGQSLHLDHANLIEEIEDRELDEGMKRALVPTAKLARWGKALPEGDFMRLQPPPAGAAPAWSTQAVPDLQLLSDRLAEGRRVALRAPLDVVTADGARRRSHFDIFLEAAPHAGGRPAFIRDEMVITNAGGNGAPGHRAVVLIEEAALAGFLGDAEGPAHTDWLSRNSKFKGKYKWGRETIAYVKGCVGQLGQMLSAADREPDREITARFFPSPRRQPAPTRARRTGPPNIRIERRNPPGFAISRAPGGFTVRPAEGPKPPAIEVKAAYDTSGRVKPLKAYDRADFAIGDGRVEITRADGINIAKTGPNWVLFEPSAEEFALEIRGFDPNRDLYVYAKALEGSVANQTD